MTNEITTQTKKETLPEIPKEITVINKKTNEFPIETLLATAGTIEATEEQKAILYAPVNGEDVEIRPDGLIYCPWMEYVTRLKNAFGMSWAIIPMGNPKVINNFVYWGFHLIIQGKLAGYAMGEQEYQPENRTMTWGDACEGAKSNALMRLCKGIGISLELWKPSFIRYWKEKYAESYYDEKKGRKLWRKKSGHITEPITPEKQPSPVPSENISQEHKSSKQMSEPELREAIHIMLTKATAGDIAKAEILLEEYTCFDSRDGDIVPGVKRLEDLRGKRLFYTYQKIKKDVESI